MDTGKTILTFLAGAAVGALTALLLAPESGERTRDRLKEKMMEGLDALEDALEGK